MSQLRLPRLRPGLLVHLTPPPPPHPSGCAQPLIRTALICLSPECHQMRSLRSAPSGPGVTQGGSPHLPSRSPSILSHPPNPPTASLTALALCLHQAGSSVSQPADRTGRAGAQPTGHPTQSGGGRGPLTGSCFSRQMLKVLVWLGFSFFRGTLVSPMNSLWRNLSSSHTEMLQAKGQATSQTPLICLQRWGRGVHK